MLIDDKTVGQPESRCKPHHPGDRRRAFFAERNHVFAEKRRTGAGAGHMHAARVAQPDRFRHRRTAQQCAEPQLIAAGEKHAAGLFDPRHPARFVGIAPGVEIHHLDLGDAEVVENLDIPRAGGSQSARRRNHHNIGVGTAAEFDETGQDRAIVFFFLSAADRNDPTARFPVGNFTGTHQVSWT